MELIEKDITPVWFLPPILCTLYVESAVDEEIDALMQESVN